MTLNKILFLYYPYIAISIFIIGSIYRYEYNQYSWKSDSSQIFEKNLLLIGSNLFHFGIIFLMLGHFIGLLTPKSIYSIIITSEKKQIIAMSFGGLAGITCLFGILILIYRRLFYKKILQNSKKTDIIVLMLLLFQLIIGLLSIKISYNHINDASSMIAFANWAQGLFLFSSEIHTYIINEHWLFKLHIIIGLTILLIFPFTRLIHIFSIPYLYLIRNGYQIVRSLK